MVNIVSGGQLAALESYFPNGYAAVDPGLPLTAYSAGGSDPTSMWSTQPSIRTVIDFVATHLASTGFSLFRKLSETDRVLVTDHPLARILALPSTARKGQPASDTAPAVPPLGPVPTYRFWHSLVVDWLLWDRWAVIKAPTYDGARGLDLVQIPSQKLQFYSDGLRRVYGIWIAGQQAEMLDPSLCIFDHGYAPISANGTSPITTLSAILQESSESVAYRRAILKNAGRIPVVLTRPAAAPDWYAPRKDGPSTFERFKASWQNFIAGGGSEGGTPILEDGMQLVKVEAFDPKSMQDIQNRTLTTIEVANAFHIAPELLGARVGNYSNMDSFRQMLYRDQLGPYFQAIEDVLNAMLVPDFGDDQLYIAANLDFKLRGSFEEQATAISTMTGGPVLTRNEARGRLNLPSLPGADALIVPLNVVAGGLASPTDTSPVDPYTPKSARRAHAKAVLDSVLAKAAKPTVDSGKAKLATALSTHYAAQAQALTADLPTDPAATDEEITAAFDAAHWDDVLAPIIDSHGKKIALAGAMNVLDEFNPEQDGWSADVMNPWLEKAASGKATGINVGILAGLLAVGLSSAADYLDSLPDRAESDATDIATVSASFGGHDAAQASGLASKTWITGDNPRPSHDAQDGETVGLDEEFSNGCRYPGDPNGDAAEVANCNCGITFSKGEES